MSTTKFNPENKSTLTYGDCLNPAMKITDSEDAKQYMKEYVKCIQFHLKSEKSEDGKTALEIAKTNLGYYDEETRMRVEKLFECSHPIFGSISNNGSPTAEQAFNAGKDIAELNKLLLNKPT